MLHGELLRIWRAIGKTIVFITNGIDEGIVLGQRVAVMSPARAGSSRCSTFRMGSAARLTTCAQCLSSAACATRSGACCEEVLKAQQAQLAGGAGARTDRKVEEFAHV
ncbi:hypothetical protein [Bradyrhizobium sp. LLZ17]|uniref:hypothetical protein n=1 Tax=Bradyrhizobium sp. LLZ17 TaxID=3239388 RepID=UPI00350F71AA